MMPRARNSNFGPWLAADRGALLQVAFVLFVDPPSLCPGLQYMVVEDFPFRIAIAVKSRNHIKI